MNAKTIFFIGVILSASGFVSPPIALLGGIAFGFSFVHPYSLDSKNLSHFLLQAAVVALGFGMNLHEVVHAGRSGFLYTAISISVAMVFGWMLGRLLKVSSKASFLITVGTAICGGSAIAAIAPITKPGEDEMAMSLGTVFILNSVALLLFPAIGVALHMSQTQFGLWSALAIHDTSSVVGAAAKYGAQALQIGTTVKLARALWIVPVAALTALATKSEARVKLPWFILLFCIAAVANTYLPIGTRVYPMLSHLGRIGLTVVLFLIGSGLSKETVKRVGVRPFLQGVFLWAIVATASLVAIRAGWITL
ncbi:YeiH family protein [Acidicapsa ligni]|uniref:YeiH family protein n=1 Tax=Acidicapsa ligni TaxID=542300 RepID=UPI0021E0B9DC|nr:putative sulfate exporter family transporter [Acidicapsa ligni]